MLLPAKSGWKRQRAISLRSATKSVIYMIDLGKSYIKYVYIRFI